MNILKEAFEELKFNEEGNNPFSEVYSVKESVESTMPATPLPHDTVYNFIQNVKAGEFFNVGYLKEETSKMASRFRGGRGSEEEPQIKVFKTSEYYGCTGVDYEHKGATINYRAETGKERTGNVYHVEADIPNRILKIGNDNKEVLQFFPKKNSRVRTQYYISIDNGDLVPVSKEEVAQYAPNPEKFLHPTISEEPSGANVIRLSLSNIYYIGNEGHSILR